MNPTIIRSVVRGVGGYLPSRVLSNAELGTMVHTTDEWIVQRTGIRQRHIAAEDETTSTLAVKAAAAALADAGLRPADIDLIVVATSTPDYTFPAVATQVQAELGIMHGVGFDLPSVSKAGETNGLNVMRERVMLLGGQFSVDANAGAGARLTAELPTEMEGGHS